jgi:hypothetical protein
MLLNRYAKDSVEIAVKAPGMDGDKQHAHAGELETWMAWNTLG